MKSRDAGLAQPIVNMEGEQVVLGPRRRELLPLYLKWVNDFVVTRALEVGLGPITMQAEEAWYERTAKDERNVGFTIYERATMRPIGNTGLHEVDYLHGTATFGIAIGETDCWGKGYATEVTRLMLDYGFTALGLHNILLTVFSYNERAIRVYLRAGFREIGRRREARRLAGQAYDVIYMDCLATEFRSPVLRASLWGCGTLL
jgi:RimJ/RimL family protein N-acetyltransferase